MSPLFRTRNSVKSTSTVPRSPRRWGTPITRARKCSLRRAPPRHWRSCLDIDTRLHHQQSLTDPFEFDDSRTRSAPRSMPISSSADRGKPGDVQDLDVEPEELPATPSLRLFPVNREDPSTFFIPLVFSAMEPMGSPLPVVSLCSFYRLRSLIDSSRDRRTRAADRVVFACISRCNGKNARVLTVSCARLQWRWASGVRRSI